MNAIYITDANQHTAYYPLHRVLKLELTIPLKPIGEVDESGKVGGVPSTYVPGSTMLPVTLDDLAYFMRRITAVLDGLSVEDTAPDERYMKAVIRVVLKDIFYDGNKWNKQCGTKGDFERETVEYDLDVHEFGQIFKLLDASAEELHAYEKYAEAFNKVYGWDEEEVYTFVDTFNTSQQDVESRAQAAADNDEEGQRIMQEEATQDVIDEEARQEMETPGEDDPLDAESLDAFNHSMEKDD
jgi:hypothetical protein